MNTTRIVNARLVNEGRIAQSQLRIAGGRIDAIAPTLAAHPGETVVDADGAWLLPGMIDDQVHFREPGLTRKGDIASESRAAVAGGITSFMDMPNTAPPTLDMDAVEDKCARAAGRAWGNYGFYLGGSNDNLDAIRAADPLRTPGVKVFMGASTGNMLVDDPAVLAGIFGESPVPIITHCEDTPIIEANQRAAIERFGEDGVTAAMHPDIRSREACIASTRLAIDLARRHDARLHVLHISTADELALFERGPLVRADGSRKRITAETCVHFLHFAREDYARLGNLIKCNPSIKDATDRDALVAALAEDVIDVLATDHAPHLLEEKRQPYLKAPSGLPLVQYALLVAMEQVAAGRLAIEQLVQKFAHAPAQLFDVAGRGYLREGHAADLVLVEQTRHEVRREDVLGTCGWSPFEGHAFGHRIAGTWVNGVRVWDGSRHIGEAAGQRLEYAR